jgi:hypothetical protein
VRPYDQDADWPKDVLDRAFERMAVVGLAWVALVLLVIAVYAFPG